MDYVKFISLKLVRIILSCLSARLAYYSFILIDINLENNCSKERSIYILKSIIIFYKGDIKMAKYVSIKEALSLVKSGDYIVTGLGSAEDFTLVL